jgi:hypothetical protein
MFNCLSVTLRPTKNPKVLSLGVRSAASRSTNPYGLRPLSAKLNNRREFEDFVIAVVRGIAGGAVTATG